MVPTQTGPDFIHSDEFEELKANDKFLLLRNYFSSGTSLQLVLDKLLEILHFYFLNIVCIF